MTASVVAVAKSTRHEFSKVCEVSITVVAGLGVEGDAHSGATVQHRSRVARDPSQPNLRQVHVIHRELLDELSATGFAASPGALGENITTSGIDLLALPVGAVLAIGDQAVLAVTGLRNPCLQLDKYEDGLLAEVAYRDEEGNLIRRAGIMTVVLASGEVRVGDPIRVSLPPLPHQALDRV